MPLISIITINFNNNVGLQKTVESVISQNTALFEYIVIDGGSSDGSASYMNAVNQHFSYCVSEKDKGIYNAMNKGIKAANGNYLLFLNSGDTLAEKFRLENIADNLRADDDIVYGDLQTLKDGKMETAISPDTMGIYELMLSTIWHPTAFIKRELFLKFGLYNETLKITADYEFFIRCIIKHQVKTKHVSVPVALFDLTGISNHPAHQQKQLEEREKSWLLNVSGTQYSLYKLYIWLKRRYLAYTGKL
jgi:glycosyltransferase involved in cell wall biosynthesis